MSAPAARMALIDTLKGGASQLIVLHHLAFYGPMSDTALVLAPDLIAWLYDYGRMAVQVFLVMAGFLAARGLAPAGVLLAEAPLALLGRRYLSLVLPFVAALLIAIVSAALARGLMDHHSLPEAPGIAQFFAHALLVHNIVGADALSAGVWYVAIDFQIFALLLGLLYLARRLGERWGDARAFALLLVGVAGGAALFVFNRNPDFDIWGIYFFGSYALGVFAYWASQQGRARWWVLAMLAAGVLALLLEYRLRIAVALVVAVVLALTQGSRTFWRPSRLWGWLGQISYSVFLVHFSVCMLVNALVQHIDAESPGFNLFGMFVAWVLSVAAGALFYRHVESRIRTLPWHTYLHRRPVVLALAAGVVVVVQSLR